MYNLFFKIFITIVIISTLSILALKPKMHKSVFLYNSSYSIVENNPKEEFSTKLPEKISIDYKTVKTIPAEVKVIKKQDKIASPTNAKKVKQNSQKNTKSVQIKPQNNIQTINRSIKQEPQVQTVQQIQKQSDKTKTLIQKEEDIAWNIWRSNLQNQIMKDVKLPYIPKGTIFQFTFDIDKYGKISNIKTWSQNPNYTPYAIQYIAPVIRSYQGKNILDFPDGTQRFSTTFKGGWKISDNAIYSTPKDYNDIEKVQN